MAQNSANLSAEQLAARAAAAEAEAAADGLTLLRGGKSGSKYPTGFASVVFFITGGFGSKRFAALRRHSVTNSSRQDQQQTCIGCFYTAEEAALAVAREMGYRVEGKPPSRDLEIPPLSRNLELA